MFDIKPYDFNAHFTTIASWWAARGVQIPDPAYFPPNGCVVYFHDQPIACGFLFKTDAGVAGIGHLVSNPVANKDVRQRGLEFLINSLVDAAYIDGFSRVTVSANIEKLFPRFEKLGFEKEDERVSIFRRDLCR